MTTPTNLSQFKHIARNFYRVYTQEGIAAAHDSWLATLFPEHRRAVLTPLWSAQCDAPHPADFPAVVAFAVRTDRYSTYSLVPLSELLLSMGLIQGLKIETGEFHQRGSVVGPVEPTGVQRPTMHASDKSQDDRQWRRYNYDPRPRPEAKGTRDDG